MCSISNKLITIREVKNRKEIINIKIQKKTQCRTYGHSTIISKKQAQTLINPTQTTSTIHLPQKQSPHPLKDNCKKIS